MGKVYDIAAAIDEVLPQVLLRGVLYRVADLEAPKRVAMEREYLALARKLMEKESEEGEVPFTDKEFERFRVLGCNLAVQGVPEEIAVTLTELEMDAIREAYLHSRGVRVGVAEKNVDGPETGSGRKTSIAS